VKKVIIIDRLKQRFDSDSFDVFADVELLTAYTHGQALQMHHNQRADLVITELHIPGIDAAEFCEQLREADPTRGVPVIVYCRDNEVEREESARCRAAAVLTLPVARTLLRVTMRRLLSVQPRREYHGLFVASRPYGVSRTGINCRMENISITGMLFAAHADLRTGEKIDCTLTIPEERPFVLRAEVVRSGPVKTPAGAARYGVRFFRLSPTARQAIERLVTPPGKTA
jgi:CheY-like chemotaxis protein